MGLPIDICAICGDVIPEGRHICNKCEREHRMPTDCVYYAETNVCTIMGCDCLCEKCTVYTPKNTF